MLESIREIVELYSGKKLVGKTNIRKYTKNNESISKGEKIMSKQARTLNSNEIRKVLDYVSTRKHPDMVQTMLGRMNTCHMQSTGKVAPICRSVLGTAHTECETPVVTNFRSSLRHLQIP